MKLETLNAFPERPGPLVLCIMDGIGYGEYESGDAYALANTPNLDYLHSHVLNCKLQAHGKAVGMPSNGDMGNSEVGHNAIGCGRVFSQGAALVNDAISSHRLFEGNVWNELIDNVQKNHSILHFIGLFSDGNVHSHIDQLKAMLTQASTVGVKEVRLHILLDGRDVGETTALDYIIPFEAFLNEINSSGKNFKIASGGGRMKLTMDRYGAEWNMVELGWKTHVLGEGRQFESAESAIRTFREENPVGDQFLPAFVIAENAKAIGAINDGDSVVFFNFRGDRSLEITEAFENDQFDAFDRVRRPQVYYAGMMEYDGDLHSPQKYLVKPPAINHTLSEHLSFEGRTQMAISETQKFGHVTYFFNGNKSGKFDDNLEEFIKIPSDIIPFEQKPEMKAVEITNKVLQTIKEGKTDFIRLNYANGDMVGHTGIFSAAKKAVEFVDIEIGKLMQAVKETNGVLIITADHGNADDMIMRDKQGNPLKKSNGDLEVKTSHSLNPVPCLIFDPGFDNDYGIAEFANAGLSNLASSCFNFLGYKAPDDYERSLICIQ